VGGGGGGGGGGVAKWRVSRESKESRQDKKGLEPLESAITRKETVAPKEGTSLGGRVAKDLPVLTVWSQVVDGQGLDQNRGEN